MAGGVRKARTVCLRGAPSMNPEHEPRIESGVSDAKTSPHGGDGWRGVCYAKHKCP